MMVAVFTLCGSALLSHASHASDETGADKKEDGKEETRDQGSSAPSAATQTSSQDPPVPQDPPDPFESLGIEAFEVRGSFDVGFRSVDVGGNEDKFREDLNLKTGPRLFNLDVDVTPVGSSFFDVLSVRASNLGGDPFESFGVTLRNYKRFSFNYRRNRSRYFYKDILLPPEEASVPLTNGGDFTTFNFDRHNDTFGFELRLTQDAKAFVNFNRHSRIGNSTYTLDISREEYEMDRPLEEFKDDYTVGFQWATSKVTFYFDETYRDYENDWRVFLPGASPGLEEDNAAELFFFEQLMPYDFKMPQSTFKVNLRPNPRLTVNFGLVYSTLDSEIDYEETTRGIAFNGAPIDDVVEGGGTIDRTTKMADIDFIYSATDWVALIGGARFQRFDQESAFTTEGDLEETAVDFSTDIAEAGLQVYPTRGLTVTGGLRYETRSTFFAHGAETEERPATDRTTFFVNGVAAPSVGVNILAEYERGDYANPFTTIAPTSMDRFKTRVRLKPVPGLSLVGVYYYRRFDNSFSEADFDSHNFNVSATYDLPYLGLYGSYVHRQYDLAVDTVKTTVGFGGGETFLFPSIYDSSLDFGRAGVRVAVGEITTTGVELTAYENTGSFALDRRSFDVFAEFRAPAGYLLRLAFRRDDYNEESFNFDDYDSNIFLMSVGYRF
jgi:hypothetical protein